MTEAKIQLKKIDEDRKTKQRYHLSVTDDGKVVFDSAFSNIRNVEHQMEAALREFSKSSGALFDDMDSTEDA